MEERDEQLIEQYLARELTEAERAAVDKRRQEDPVFDQEVKDYEMALLALKLQQREALRQRFAKRDIELDKKKPAPPSTGRRWYLWIAVAAILFILVAFIWKLLNKNDAPAQPSTIVTEDSLQHHQEIIAEDSSGVDIPDNEQEESPKEDTDDPKKGNKKTSQEKERELFAANFEPYRDPMMDPTTRGEEEPSPRDQFRKAYWEGRYGEVQSLFQKIDPSDQQKDNYRFQLANALLKTGKTDEAIVILTSVVANAKSKFVTESHFYLGMAFLQKGDAARATEWLDKYVKLEKGKQKEKANLILSALRK